MRLGGLICVGLVGCPGSPLPALDSGVVVDDAGEVDAGAADASVVDAGVVDAGVVDAGAVDAGTVDAGVVDAGNACALPWPVQLNPPSAPPYAGTVYVEPGLITSADPTSFRTLTATGHGLRQIFDRRVNAFVTVDAWLFDAQFGANKHVEVQVNPEFTQAQAETHARTHATIVGRLPAFAFRDLDMLWINGGKQLYGGGNRSILIHTEQTVEYEAGGWTEEVMLHESGHTSLDSYHQATARWLEARTADGVAISTYARDNPTREDVAETLSMWFAVRFRSSRLSTADQQKVRAAVPSRLSYFDCLGLTDAPLP
ncbi:MAG: hypothetical protein JNK82_39325 [Myxococcaceae bacterium]|nr:hypothetical protein [Myxococcaceae bacterium]